MKRRTQQIDDDREVLITKSADGTPIFTKAGQIRMHEHEKEELSSNIRNNVQRGHAFKIAEKIVEQGAKFGNMVFCDIAPPELVDAITQDPIPEEAKLKFVEWVKQNEFKVIQDGLKTVVKIKGKVLAEHEATVPFGLNTSVRKEIDLIVHGKN